MRLALFGRGTVLAALGLAAGPPAAAQAPGASPIEFRTGVEAVYVDAFVTRAGRSLTGLRPSDLELRDNGVSQELELLAAESRPLLALLVFDTSGSLAGARLNALRVAGEAFLEALRPEDQAGLMAFSEEIGWLAQPTPDKAQVRSALGELRASGATAVFDAVYAAIALSEGGQRPLVVLFSDGEDNSSWLDERQVRLMAERSNALVHVVGWRSPPARSSDGYSAKAPESLQERALREIAETTGGHYWGADSPDRLREAFRSIAHAMSQRYVLRYEPVGVKREGWHRIEVRLRGRKGQVHVRKGYWVAP